MAHSEKAIRTHFAGDLRKLANPDGAVKAIRQALQAYEHGEMKALHVLHAVNGALNAHGVEPLYINDMYEAQYVNTGDTYSATLLFVSKTGKFRLTTWGDFYENSGY